MIKLIIIVAFIALVLLAGYEEIKLVAKTIKEKRVCEQQNKTFKPGNMVFGCVPNDCLKHAPNEFTKLFCECERGCIG